jgi:hypothetical protein
VSIEIDGAPPPEVAAAIIAAVESVIAAAATAPAPHVSAWRRAAIRDNLRAVPGTSPGAGWSSPRTSL